MLAPWRNTLAKSKQKTAGLSLSDTTNGYELKKLWCMEGMVDPWRNTLYKSKEKTGYTGLITTDVSILCQVDFSASGRSFVQRSCTKYDREASIMKRPRPTTVCSAMVMVQVFPLLIACSYISILPPSAHPYETYQNDNLVNSDKHQNFDAEETRLLTYYIFIPLKLCEKDFFCIKIV